MICSFLIPARGSIKKTMRCLKLIEAERNPDVEAILRIDDDDDELMSAMDVFTSMRGVKVRIGKRGKGLTDQPRFYREAAELASGSWHWLFNNDMFVRSIDSNWTNVLETIPRESLVQPEWTFLNQSRYYQDPHSGCPIISLSAYTLLGGREETFPDDHFWVKFLCGENKWPTVFLPSVIAVHDWKTEDNDDSMDELISSYPEY
jgi:hypothetical protein